MAADIQTKTDEKVKEEHKEPNRYRVVFLNDDYTPMEFVVGLLTSVFKHNESSAISITMKIHNEGASIVGVYTYEVAEQKMYETVGLARDRGFPLRVMVEEDV